MRYAIALVAGCSFSAPLPNPGTTDAIVEIDAYVPDAPQSCAMVTPPTCVPDTNVLRECKAVGEPAVDVTCDWGCLDADPDRCGKLAPSGGALSPSDLEPTAGLEAKTLSTSLLGILTFDTGTGEIRPLVRPGGDGIRNGIDFRRNNNVAIWRFEKLTLTTLDGARVRVVGPSAAALVSISTIDVERTIIDLRGDCTGNLPGPGGSAGGGTGSSGSNGGEGGASYTGNDSGGGAGGGHGAIGGDGGAPGNVDDADGGATFGTPTISSLAGGGGGGGGGGPSGGVGGGGGGAIQLAANGAIKLTGVVGVYAGINAGGCGGKPGQSGDAGGGGGAGGAILIEGSSVRLEIGGLAVNGGGGGGGDSVNAGANGQFATTRAGGGAGMNGAGNGGAGGAAGETNGNSNHPGESAPVNDNGGGGGGGVGRIRVNTANGEVTLQNGSFVSPSFTDANSPATRGQPAIE